MLVLLNAVDLERFEPRAPLPERPKRALVYSNSDSHFSAIEAACARAGLELDVLGAKAGNAAVRPELELPRYDLVFAKARCALEALAVGTAVVLCDAVGAGPLVTTENLGRLRRLNFGIRALDGPVEPEPLLEQIERYDAADAAEVASRVRATAGLDALVDELLGLYGDVIEEHRSAGTADREAEGRAAAAYVRSLGLAAEDNAFGLLVRERIRRFPALERAFFALRRHSASRRSR